MMVFKFYHCRQRHPSTSSVPSSYDIEEELEDTMDTDDEGDNERPNESEVMDETTAALVLTSLSCSPLSSETTPKFKDKGWLLCKYVHDHI